MATSSGKMRAWSGPAVFGYGFRPFFLGAAIWAAFAMGIWLAVLRGWVAVPSAFDPVSWHAHELLFGYLGAVMAGFLLTAVPNWTGRLPIAGWPLAALFGLWALGRVAVLVSGSLPPPLVAAADLSFGVFLALVLAREIVAGRNRRNLTTVGCLVGFVVANVTFHWETMQGAPAAQGTGLRLGLASGLMMLALIGGRIVPSFTRNWMAARGEARLPTPPMQRLDRVALCVLLAALAIWVVRPEHPATGAALLVAGTLHLARLARWSGHRTGSEPLVWALHLGYAFLPLGALALAMAMLWPGTVGAAPAQHLWMAGAVGQMTLSVMTRATLGHTGQALSAGSGTTALYLLVTASVVARLLASVQPAWAMELHAFSGICWIAAFAGFALLYGGSLLRPRKSVD